MASRNSARSASNHNQPSSPARRSMRTRSASVELGDDNAAPVMKKGKRGVRQASVDSVDSNASVTSSNHGGRRTRATRGAVQPELSLVQEEEQEIEESDDEAAEAEGSGVPHRSPGGLSQMSGTTAITSASAQTSHSQAELADLDTMLILDVLPDLWVSSLQILALTPAVPTLESVGALVKDLKIPGSVEAKRLMHREQKFIVDREHFGNDVYIRPSFVLRKIFGTDEVHSGLLRPDAILQSGNLATFIKDLLVKQKEKHDTYQFLSNLDTWFPESFVTQFEDHILFGHSTLLEESFHMALEIRTQYTIVALMYQNIGDSDIEWDPVQVLLELFFEPLKEPTENLSPFEDMYNNGKLKNLLRTGPSNSGEQDDSIRARVLEIHSTFRDSEDAAQAGDLVDWDELENRFSWSAFLTDAIIWSRSRQDEIIESVRVQGGVDEIVKSLVESIKNNDSQAELNYEPPPVTSTPRQLLPPADIIPASSGHNLMTKSTVSQFQAMKQSLSRPTSAQGGSIAAASERVAPSSFRNVAPASRLNSFRQRENELEDEDDSMLIDNDRDDEALPQGGNRNAEPYRSTWDAYRRSENKENTPEMRREKGKAVLAADKPQGSRDDQGRVETSAGSSKRKYQVGSEDDESEMSQDEGFQADRRTPIPTLRTTGAVGRREGPVPVEHRVTKRVRGEDDDHSDAARARRGKAEDELQASARGATADDEGEIDDEIHEGASLRQPDEEDEDDFEDDAPAPTASEVGAMARQRAAIARLGTARRQVRKYWSGLDERHFLDLIEEFGCAWSVIEKVAEFEEPRTQVQLKDKARNLKVLYLKSGVRLPPNFEHISMGQKEIRAVQNVIPEYRGMP